MFDNGIDQSINTIRFTHTNFFIKNRETIVSLFDCFPNSFSSFFSEMLVPSRTKGTRKTSSKQVNNFTLRQILICIVSISNHGHMIHLIEQFLFKQTINIPLIKFIRINKKLNLEESFFKLQIRRSGFGIPIFWKIDSF